MTVGSSGDSGLQTVSSVSSKRSQSNSRPVDYKSDVPVLYQATWKPHHHALALYDCIERFTAQKASATTTELRHLLESAWVGYYNRL